MAATNWIADENKFGLQKPPDWWLKRLFDFDHMLVVLPSRKTAKAYLLARRRQHTAGLGDVAMLDNKHPDTNMCYVHHVLPIAPLNINGENPFTEKTITTLIAELRKRDTWAKTSSPTGGEQLDYADAVEAAEKRREEAERKTLRDSFYHRGRDAWRSLKARIGSRNKRASDYHGVARTPQRKAGV